MNGTSVNQNPHPPPLTVYYFSLALSSTVSFIQQLRSDPFLKQNDTVPPQQQQNALLEQDRILWNADTSAAEGRFTNISQNWNETEDVNNTSHHRSSPGKHQRLPNGSTGQSYPIRYLCDPWHLECTYDECLASFAPYVVVGLPTAVGSLIIMLVLGKDSKTRSRYFLLVALASGDLCNGLGYFLAGIMRLSICDSKLEMIGIKPIDCMAKPYIPLFIFGSQLPICITLIIAVERYMIVTYPISSTFLPIKKWCRISVLVSYIFCFGSLGVACVVSYIISHQDYVVSDFCFTSWSMGDYFSIYFYSFSILIGSLAVIVYIMAIWSIKKNFNQISGKSRRAGSRIMRQLQVTKTMGIVVGSTFFLFMLPDVTFVIPIFFDPISRERAILGNLATFCSPFFCVNSGINIFIYYFTNEDFRQRLKQWFRSVCCFWREREILFTTRNGNLIISTVDFHLNVNSYANANRRKSILSKLPQAPKTGARRSFSCPNGLSAAGAAGGV